MMEKHDQIKAEIRQRFEKIARTPQQEKTFPVGPVSAKRLGYDAAEVDALPTAVTESFAGVGNPFTLAELRPGHRVLDLGCGAGLDSILSARRVAPGGWVIGVDFVADMLAKAERNAQALGVTNVEFRHGDTDALPVEDGSIDVVISNGVLSLCPDKPRVLGEAIRVLRPGGVIHMADILLEEGVTPEEVALKGAWSD